MAQVLIHYGKYREALMKLRFVALEQPNNKDLENIIKLVEKHING